MPISGPQALASFYDVDNVVTVTMKANGDISDWDLTTEVTDKDQDDAVVAAPDTSVTTAGSSSSKGVVTITFAPDLLGLKVGGKYHFWLYREDVGARDVIAHGPLSVRKRKKVPT